MKYSVLIVDDTIENIDILLQLGFSLNDTVTVIK